MEMCAIRLVGRAAGVLVTCAVLQAGEQVQFKGSTSVELPKPKRPLEDDRKMKSDTERPTLQGGFVTTPIDSSPLSNRKLREELDKKKNWIFMNPYEQNLDSKTEEFMSGEKGTGLYDNEWMSSKEDKSLVQQFLEEKDGRTRESREEEDLSDRSKTDREPGVLSNRTEDLDRSRPETPFSEGSAAAFEKRILDPTALPDSFKNGALDKSFERNLSGDPFATRRPVDANFEREEFRKQQVAHDRDFDQIINTRLGSGGSPVVGRLDNLTVGGGVGQLNLNQGPAGRSTDLGRSTLRGPSTVTFTDGGTSFGGAGRPAFENRGFGGEGIGLTPKALPSYAPPVAVQNPASQRPAFTPASPFSSTLPRRKF